jgi:hypothetical protein
MLSGWAFCSRLALPTSREQRSPSRLVLTEVAYLALVLLGGEVIVLVTLTAGTALVKGTRAARTLWGLAKLFAGMGLGTVAACCIAALLLLIRSR